jgi:hypothetical protein
MAAAERRHIRLSAPIARRFCGRKVETGPALQFDEHFATSRLLFLAKFLETRIIPERIEHRIEPQQRRSKRRA